jgi:Gamma-glutamyl cyclotransferase, AIG2-like
MDSTVLVFFYGGLINPKMLARVGMKPKRHERATLTGFDLRISPYVNLVRSPDAMVFGLLMEVSRSELQLTYSRLKAVYVPEAVLVTDSGGRLVPALCYIVPDMAPDQAEVDHVLMLATAAEELGFPQWYLDKIRSFLPRPSPRETMPS